MKRFRGLALAGALFALTACSAPLPFAAPQLVPLPSRSAAEVAALDWSTGTGVLLVRQSVLFELRGGRFPANGALRLDRDAGIARLVGLDDFGVKLFDLSVTAAGFEEHFLMPELARRPGLAAAIAASVRRIWLDPRPSGRDILTNAVDRYRLARRTAGGETFFLFGGDPPQLLEKRHAGEDGDWRVRYFEYRDTDGLSWPRGIVLDDDTAGYRLTVWIESVRRGGL